MKTQPYLLALSAGLASSSPIWNNHSSHDLTVHTTSGIVSGFVDPKYPSVRQFLGIPYAQPPTGTLRFGLPQRLNTPKTHRNGTRTPFACPQVPASAGGPNVFTVSAPQFDNAAPWDEDCLSVSVWTPSRAAADGPLPVLVWIHGGGLISGSSSVAYQQPPGWIQRTRSHVVVAMQYRLDIFGFPNAAGLDRTNLGLLDQRMALEWARDNAAAFDGDPSRMVLWGQSSGAGSVDAQNFAFPSDPIVRGFISDSGSALFPPGTGLATSDPTHSNFSAVAAALGCASRSPPAELACMRALPASTIISFLTDYTTASSSSSSSSSSPSPSLPRLNFIATPDDLVVFPDYPARYAKGLLSDRPAIFGSNADEGVVMIPFPDPGHPSVPPAPSDLATAARLTGGIYRCPAYASASMRAAAGRETFLYLYAGNFSDVSPEGWEGAYHMSELPQVFGTRGEGRGKVAGLEGATSEAMQDLWLGFARDPENAGRVGWRGFGSGEMLVFGGEGEPVRVRRGDVVNKACM